MGAGMPQNFMENLDKDLSQKAPTNTEPPQTKEPVPQPTNTEPPQTKEPVPQPTNTEPPQTKEPVTQPSELDNDRVLEYLNRDRETPFESFEEVFQTKEITKEVTKEVNPWEDVLDPEDLAYLNFKKETNGRSRKEFEFLKSDIEKKPVIDLAIEKVKRDTGMDLTPAQAKEYLESKLNIDLESEQLSSIDSIELNSYVKPFRDQLLEDKAKIKVPLEKKPTTGQRDDLVQLDNGNYTTKENLQQQDNIRSTYLKSLQEEGNRVTSFDYSIEINDNGEKKTIDFSFEPSQDDRHSMVSDASDIDAFFEKRFQTKDGLNHKELKKSIWWMDPKNQQKVMTALVEKTRAELIEEITKNGNNENFGRKPLPKTEGKKDGYGSLDGNKGHSDGSGIKYQFDTNK